MVRSKGELEERFLHWGEAGVQVHPGPSQWGRWKKAKGFLASRNRTEVCAIERRG